MSNKTHEANHWINNVIITIGSALYKPDRDWFLKIIIGALFTCSTVSSWIRAVGEEGRFKKFYHHLYRIGIQIQKIQEMFTFWLIEQYVILMPESGRIILVADDSPNKRYGPKVEGAGWHHDPTSPNIKATTCYGHSLVVLSLIFEHPNWGTICLPLLNRLYIREEDLKKIDKEKRPKFRTKLQLLIEMVQEVRPKLKVLNKPIQLLFDRGYVSEEVFKAMAELGIEIVTRFKSNVNLYNIPTASIKKRPGRPKKYGDPLKAENITNDGRRKFVRTTVSMYGRQQLLEYKTLILTSHITNGKPIRVVVSRLIKRVKSKKGKTLDKVGPSGTFVSTNLDLSPEEIIASYSKRFSIEEMFKDMKEVCGLGKQQVRSLESNLACIQIIMMDYALVEILAWNKDESYLKSNRPVWDDIERRPSHKDKRTALQLELRWMNFSRLYAKSINPKILNELKYALFNPALTT